MISSCEKFKEIGNNVCFAVEDCDDAVMGKWGEGKSSWPDTENSSRIQIVEKGKTK